MYDPIELNKTLYLQSHSVIQIYGLTGIGSKKLDKSIL